MAITRNPVASMRMRSIMQGRPSFSSGSGPNLRTPPPQPQMGGFRGMNFRPPVSTPPYVPQQPALPEFDFSGDFDEAPPPSPPSRSGPNDSLSQYFEAMKQVRASSGPGLSAYKEALNEMPTPDQYKPNWLSRIAAGLSGFGAGMKDPGEGVRVAREINETPYRNAMEQYTGRLGTLKEQADIEQDDVNSQLDALYKAQQMGLKYDELGLKTRETDALINSRGITAGAAQTRAQAAMMQAQTAADELKTKGIISTPQQDGSLQVFNPRTGQTQLIPGNSIAAFVAQSGRMSAGAAQSQAATSRGRLTLDQQLEPRRVAAAEGNAGANIYRALNPTESTANQFISPAATDKAREVAEQELMADPEFGPLLARRGNQYWNWLSEDEKRTLEEEIQDRADEIIKRRR